MTAERRRDPEQDLACADCGREPARLRTVDGRTVCEPSCPVTVTAVFDRLDGSPAFERDVELSHRGGWVYMRGGPTGYESLPVTAASDFDHQERGWVACFGTRGRWAECTVPAAEMRRAFRELPIA